MIPQSDTYSYRLLTLNQAGTLVNFAFPIDGQKLIYVNPTDGPEITVRLNHQSNDPIPLRPQGVIVAPFTRLYISGVIGTSFPQLVIASPASFSVEPRDVNVNSIATISQLNTILNPVIAKDFTLERTGAGFGFSHSVDLAASAGSFGLVQLWNPVGSGKTLLVHQGIFYSDALLNYLISANIAALPTLVGAGINRNLGGSAGVGELRTQLAAALPGFVSTPLQFVLSNTFPSLIVPLTISVPPGNGLVVYNNTVNHRNIASFSWTEL